VPKKSTPFPRHALGVEIFDSRERLPTSKSLSELDFSGIPAGRRNLQRQSNF
jgi:hypothetical protein